jgi:spermidine synthase
MNLWGTNKALFSQIAWNLQQVFGEQLLFLPVRGRGNVIGLAFNENFPKIALKQLRIRALELQAHYQLEFPNFVSDLKKHNPHTFHRFVKT